MSSATYQIFRDAILNQQQVVCVYQGHRRELCPIIIGHTNGVEKVLAYQIGGGSSSGLPPGGEWRCMTLSQVSQAQRRNGPWREGLQQRSDQTCVKDVDIDINIHVRKRR
jgi:hypothetical protein